MARQSIKTKTAKPVKSKPAKKTSPVKKTKPVKDTKPTKQAKPVKKTKQKDETEQGGLHTYTTLSPDRIRQLTLMIKLAAAIYPDKSSVLAILGQNIDNGNITANEYKYIEYRYDDLYPDQAQSDTLKLYRLVLNWCGGEGEYEGQLMPLYESDLSPTKEGCIQQAICDHKHFQNLAWEIRCHVDNNWKDVPPYKDGFVRAMRSPDKYPKVRQFCQAIQSFLPKMLHKSMVSLSDEIEGFRVLPDCLQVQWQTLNMVRKPQYGGSVCGNGCSCRASSSAATSSSAGCASSSASSSAGGCASSASSCTCRHHH